MEVKNKIKSHPHMVGYFKELPFYEKLHVVKTKHAFSGYAMSYKVKLVGKKFN